MALIAMGTLAIPAPAFAHVSVDPKTVDPGGFAKVSLRVPNERDNASTVQVEVAFPKDHPLGHVSIEPVPGWSALVKKERLATPLKSGDEQITEAVTSIVWKGGQIGPGEFQEFEMSMGRLPETSARLAFMTIQTYSNREVVRWIEVPQSEGAEPEKPAPMLTVAPVTAKPAAVPAGSGSSTETDTSPASSGAGRSSVVVTEDAAARWLGGAGLFAGVIGIATAVLSRRSRASASYAGTPNASRVKVGP
ncbi:YcnI family protein [Actinopolymorpha alba]|uniref:YcnI family copper-binding membrane protein n=1 Tax=Actinopolymorpha alba TaxID=533267 RepID=UPI00192C5C7C|nr:YcnI family protein [Actinopolymorpha alba]